MSNEQNKNDKQQPERREYGIERLYLRGTPAVEPRREPKPPKKKGRKHRAR